MSTGYTECAAVLVTPWVRVTPGGCPRSSGFRRDN